MESTVNMQTDTSEPRQVFPPPGTRPVAAAHPGSGCVLEEFVREESVALVISSEGKQHTATAPIYQAQMRCQGSTATPRVASPFLHRLPICHHK